MAIFFDSRDDAARQLAHALAAFRGRNPLVLAIPRGAVGMGRVIADELGGELDVVLVRKLRSPLNPEFAVGSIDETRLGVRRRARGQRRRRRQVSGAREAQAARDAAQAPSAVYARPAPDRSEGPHRDRGRRRARDRRDDDRSTARGAREAAASG